MKILNTKRMKLANELLYTDELMQKQNAFNREYSAIDKKNAVL